jgi:hypothetical protein
MTDPAFSWADGSLMPLHVRTFQVGSGVAIDLGVSNCLTNLEFVQDGRKGLAKWGNEAQSGGAGLNVAGEIKLGIS